MLELIQKADAQIRSKKHVDARNILLTTILPLLRQMVRENAKVFQQIDGNFREVFLTLNISDDKHFLDATLAHVTLLHATIDEILLIAEFAAPGENGVVQPTEKMPKELLAKLLALQAGGAAWFEEYEAVRSVAESELDEDEDDDPDDDDDEDEDEDENELEENELEEEELETTADNLPTLNPVVEEPLPSVVVDDQLLEDPNG